jgi:hypothetical protein
MKMKPVQRRPANDTLYRRIDAMPMNATDRAIAKANLRAADSFVDAVFDLITALRSMAASVSRHVRIALTASPQH